MRWPNPQVRFFGTTPRCCSCCLADNQADASDRRMMNLAAGQQIRLEVLRSAVPDELVRHLQSHRVCCHVAETCRAKPMLESIGANAGGEHRAERAKPVRAACPARARRVLLRRRRRSRQVTSDLLNGGI